MYITAVIVMIVIIIISPIHEEAPLCISLISSFVYFELNAYS